jgi:CheY-like chemotaxis protein/predicted regulator of Ras-like GTPase activity (Roadblock/LC7/MglB family)
MKKVLIVDDEKSLLLSIRAGFEAYKDRFQLVTAEDGKKAVKVLESTTIDLVVTDIRMPEMDGFELLVYMNTRFPLVPVLVMSAYGTREIQGRFESIGIIGFLDKPVDFDDLVKGIEEGLKQTSQVGTMTGFSVGSFLQLIEMEEKTCLLEVSARGKKGLFYFDRGVLFDAVSGRLIGEEAAIEMIMWNQVSLSFKSLPDKKIMRRINSELMPIMMEASRRKDEKLHENELGAFDEALGEELNFLEGELVSLKTDDNLLAMSEPQKINEPEWLTPECPGPSLLLSTHSEDIFGSLLPEMDQHSIGKQPAKRIQVIESLLPDTPYRISGNPSAKQFTDLFKKMAAEMHGGMMISLMDIDGIPIAEHNPAQIPSDVFAAKFAMIIGTIEKTLKEFEGVGDLKETIFQASDAWIVCRLVTPGFYLGLMVNQESTLGNIRLVLGKYVEKIRQMLP